MLNFKEVLSLFTIKCHPLFKQTLTYFANTSTLIYLAPTNSKSMLGISEKIGIVLINCVLECWDGMKMDWLIVKLELTVWQH